MRDQRQRRFRPEHEPNRAEVCRFRPRPRPSANLPFGARSVGRVEFVRGEGYDLTPRNTIHVFWGAVGSGRFAVGRREFEVPPDHVFFFLPWERQRYWAESDRWRLYWLSIDGPLTREVFASFGRGRSPWYAGPCPLEDFEELDRQIGDPTPEGEREACATAFRILLRATGSARPRGPDFHVVSRSLRLIADHLADADLGVKWLASELQWNRSSLSRAFRGEKGMPPSKYIEALRIQRATRLLLSTPKSVADIAAECGYRDPDYFCKAFRRAIGESPRQFRASRLASCRRAANPPEKRR